MSEENELLTTYQKLKKQVDKQSAENKLLTEKVNSLVTLLEKERAEKADIEKHGLLEKINTINPDFKPSDDMDATALRWILKGLEIAPKSNSTPESSDQPDKPINPEPEVPKINGKPIDPELMQFVAQKEDSSKIFDVVGRSVE